MADRELTDAQFEEHVEDLRAFVGPRSDYYIRKWAPRLLDPAGEVGMNWVVVFFPFIWFCYRKMYQVAAIFMGVAIFESIAEQVVFLGVLKMPKSPPGIGLIINLVTSTICGVYANAWYLSHAERIIAKSRAEGNEGEMLWHVLARRGGTSVLAAVLPTLIMFFLLMVVVFFAVLLRVAATR